MDSKKKDASAFALATAIAARLTDRTWSAKRVTDGDDDVIERLARIVRADGASVFVSVGGYRLEGRACFRTEWPAYADGQSYTPREYSEITCSADRDPKALARELEKRLLAKYEPLYLAALKSVQEANDAATAAWEAATRLALVAGASVPEQDGYRRRRTGATVELYPGSRHVHRLRVSPPSADRPVEASFEVSGVDEATAAKVLALLAEKREA